MPAQAEGTAPVPIAWIGTCVNRLREPFGITSGPTIHPDPRFKTDGLFRLKAACGEHVGLAAAEPGQPARALSRDQSLQGFANERGFSPSSR